MKTINSTSKDCLKNTVGLFICLLLCGCITEFEPKGIDEVEGILVVEGFITDDESVITLSRSKGITYDDLGDMYPYRVTDAKVSIECDDGTQWAATGQNRGEYTVETGKLNHERQYRLKIEIDEHEYQSEFACPIATPEIDSVFWTKEAKEEPVKIHIATHAPDSTVQYYRWSYREEWELRPNYQVEDPWKGKCTGCNTFYDFKDIFCPNCGLELARYPNYCWNSAVNSGMLLGSTEKMISARVAAQLAEMPPKDVKLEWLYRIDVRQFAISKRAYDYFTNVKKNAEQTGGLVAHVPSELKGNISCMTDPSRVVIGYMEVSSTARKRLYISRLDDAYELDFWNCREINYGLLMLQFPQGIPGEYVSVRWQTFVHESCIDCTWGGATKYRPDDWPDMF